MSTPKPPNPQQLAEIARQTDYYLRIAQEALEKQLAVPKPDDVEERTDNERQSLEREKLKIENRRLTAKVERSEDVHKVRKQYANRLFWLIVGWLVVVLIFIALAGFHVKGFTLSEKVLIAFITSTTINVLGLFLVPARWLFPKEDKEDK